MLQRFLDNRLRSTDGIELCSPFRCTRIFTFTYGEGKGHMDIVFQCTFKVQEILTEFQQGRQQDTSSIKPPPSRGTRISTVHV